MQDTRGKTVPVTGDEIEQTTNEKKENKPVKLTPAKIKEINEAMRDGCGKLELKTPFIVGEEEITELEYDFNELTGIEYADAMDSDMRAGSSFKVTYRQGLALFACAAAKQTPGVDMKDILEKMGVEDGIEAVQLGTLFFSISTREGQQRISKK